MSQQDLADKVEVTRQTISSIEKSKFVPSALLALKIEKYFGKSVEKFFFIEDDDGGNDDHSCCHRGNLGIDDVLC
jgi:putative transcriptional regulator